VLALPSQGSVPGRFLALGPSSRGETGQQVRVGSRSELSGSVRRRDSPADQGESRLRRCSGGTSSQASRRQLTR